MMTLLRVLITYEPVVGPDSARSHGWCGSHHEALMELWVSQQSVSCVTALSQADTGLTLNSDTRSEPAAPVMIRFGSNNSCTPSTNQSVAMAEGNVLRLCVLYCLLFNMKEQNGAESLNKYLSTDLYSVVNGSETCCRVVALLLSFIFMWR